MMHRKLNKEKKMPLPDAAPKKLEKKNQDEETGKATITLWDPKWNTLPFEELLLKLPPYVNRNASKLNYAQINACLQDLQGLVTQDNSDLNLFYKKYKQLFDSKRLLKLLIETIFTTCSTVYDCSIPQPDSPHYIQLIRDSQARIQLMNYFISISKYSVLDLSTLKSQYQFFLNVFFDYINRNLGLISDGFYKGSFTTDRITLTDYFKKTKEISTLFSPASPFYAFWIDDNLVIFNHCSTMLRWPLYEAKYLLARAQDDRAFELLALKQSEIEVRYYIPIDKLSATDRVFYSTQAQNILSTYPQLRTEVETNVKRKTYKYLYDCTQRSLDREDTIKRQGNPVNLPSDQFKILITLNSTKLIQLTEMTPEIFDVLPNSFILIQAACIVNYHDDEEILRICSKIAHHLKKMLTPDRGHLFVAHVLKYLDKQLTEIETRLKPIEQTASMGAQEDLPKKIEHLKTEIDRHEQLIKKSEREIALQKQKNKAATRVAEELKAQKAETLKQNERILSKLQKENQQKKEYLAQQKEKLAEQTSLNTEQEKQALQAAIDQLKQDNEALEGQLAETQTNHNKMRQAMSQEIQALEKEIPTLEKTLAQLKQQSKKMTQENQAAQTQYNQTIAKLTQENESYKTQQVTQEQVFTQIKLELAQAQTELSTLEQDIAHMINNHQNLVEYLQNYLLKPMQFHEETLLASHKSILKKATKLGLLRDSPPPPSAVPPASQPHSRNNLSETSEELEKNLKTLLFRDRTNFPPAGPNRPPLPMPPPTLSIIHSPPLPPSNETRTLLPTPSSHKAFLTKTSKQFIKSYR